MNLAHFIPGDDLVVMRVEDANMRQRSASLVGYVDEKSYNRLREFTFVVIIMNIEATDGNLKYIYRLRPHYVERLSRENGISKVKINSSQYMFLSSETFR